MSKFRFFVVASAFVFAVAFFVFVFVITAPTTTTSARSCLSVHSHPLNRPHRAAAVSTTNEFDISASVSMICAAAVLPSRNSCVQLKHSTTLGTVLETHEQNAQARRLGRRERALPALGGFGAGYVVVATTRSASSTVVR
ncbi:hypothetical protein RI054_25g107070 [Pseudoscourfieldia marina]